MPVTLLRAPSDFQTFLRHCKLYRIYSFEKAAYIISCTLLKNVNINLTSLLGNFVIKLQTKKLIPSTIFLDAKAISGH